MSAPNSRWPGRRLRLFPLLLTIFAFQPAVRTVAGEVPPDNTVYYPLHVTFEDGEGQPIVARCTVQGSDATWYRPYPDSLCIYHNFWRAGYFYADGSFDVTVPQGTTKFFVSRGFEFAPVVRTIEVLSDTTLSFVLSRWIDLREEGWYCADPGPQLRHQHGLGYNLGPEEGLFAATAEGLNVVYYADNEYCFAGAPDPVSTADCIVYFSEEYRSFAYGHLGLLGIDQMVLPPTYPAVPAWPMNMTILQGVYGQTCASADWCHPRSACSVMDSTDWPGGGLARELPIDVLELEDHVQTMDVLSYSNHSSYNETMAVVEMWYELLNSRIKIWASAGTDACLDRSFDPPIGGQRVYVNLGDSTFTHDNWLEAKEAGRSFITTGPLFRRFQLGDAQIGDSLIIDSGVPTWVEAEISFASYYPVEEIEIIQNGRVAASIAVPVEVPQMVDTTFNFLIDETGWVAARAMRPNNYPTYRWLWGDSLIAHTNPIFVRYGKDRLYSGSDYWVTWLDTLVTYLDWHNTGEWANPSDSAFVYQRVAQARDYYDSVATEPPPPRLVGEEIPILTYNIYHGGQDFGSIAGRDHEWLEVIRSRNPDIILIQEANGWLPADSNYIAAYVESLNVSFPEEPPYTGWVGDANSDFDLAIMTRFQVESVETIHGGLLDGTWYDLGHAFLHATLADSASSIHIINLHFRPGLDREGREKEARILLQVLDEIPTGELVCVGGDFNSYSPVDVEPGSPTPPAYDLGADSAEVVGWEPAGYLVDRGYEDAFRTLHPLDCTYTRPTREFYGPLEPNARVDFLLRSPDPQWVLETADVVTDGLADVGSDHYPIFARYCRSHLTDAPETKVEVRTCRMRCWPNPFSSQTVVEYEIARPGPVTLDVYSVLGRLVCRLDSESGSAGMHRLQWDGKTPAGQDLPAGWYYVRLRSGTEIQTTAVLLLR